MPNRLTQLYLARIRLESVTPLSIGTGSPDQVFDSSLVRDANDLPGIPGTSIAGVLRHLYERAYHPLVNDRDNLFGYQDRQSASASRLQISWGCIENQRGNAVEGLVSLEDIESDPLLFYARKGKDEPDYRNRARIGYRGAAVNQGKFDRAILPTGYRFRLELSMQGKDDDIEAWERVLQLFYHPLFRLGAGTRCGLGAFCALSVHQRIFQLTEPAEQQAFVDLSRQLHQVETFQDVAPKGQWNVRRAALEIRQSPGQGWRIGSGSHPLRQGENKEADLSPITENVVDWSSGLPVIIEKLLIPGSSIKGALAHRLVFHYARHQKIWAETLLPKTSADGQDVDNAMTWTWQKQSEFAPLAALLGIAKESANDDERNNRAGKLHINDVYLELPHNEKVAVQPHNAIDTFTGGVRQRMLFSEEVITDQTLNLVLFLEASDYESLDDSVKLALRDALNDLANGRLALGAAAGRGHGFFNGSVTHFDASSDLRTTA